MKKLILLILAAAFLLLTFSPVSAGPPPSWYRVTDDRLEEDPWGEENSPATPCDSDLNDELIQLSDSKVDLEVKNENLSIISNNTIIKLVDIIIFIKIGMK